jgi:hypothetical protein
MPARATHDGTVLGGLIRAGAWSAGPPSCLEDLLQQVQEGAYRRVGPRLSGQSTVILCRATAKSGSIGTSSPRAI